jgi:hypothetical protein
MLFAYLFFPGAAVLLLLLVSVAARRPHITWTDHPCRDAARLRRQSKNVTAPPHFKLWAAIVLLSAVEALVARATHTDVFAPVYVAANFFAVLAFLLLASWPQYFDLSVSPATGATLLHIFTHVACALYLRVTCWLLFTGSVS